MFVSLTGLSHIGQATIGTECRGVFVVVRFTVGQNVARVCRHQTRDAIKVEDTPSCGLRG
jgi:hypothetical protein